jgi:hypothetical protein
MANADDSGLDQQLASSDVASCRRSGTTGRSQTISRTKTARRRNRYWARDFCHVGTYQGLYQLYRKCK